MRNLRWIVVACGLGGAVRPAGAFVGPSAAPDVVRNAPGTDAVAATAEVTRAFAARAAWGWALEWSPELAHVWRGELGSAPVQAAVSPATIAGRAAAFVAATAEFTGAKGAELSRVRCEPGGRAWHTTWVQQSAGVPVEGAWLDLVQRPDGEVVAFTSTLARDVAAPAARIPSARALEALEARWGPGLRVQNAGLVVVPGGNGTPARRAWRLEVRRRAMEHWVALVDAGDGSVLAAESLVRTLVQGACTVEAQPFYAQDEAVVRPLPWTRVVLTGGTLASTFGDGHGEFVFDATRSEGLRAGTDLHGRYLSVGNAAGEPVAGAGAVVPAVGPAVVHLGAGSGRLDERTIYVHANRIHDDVRERFDFRLLDFPMPAVAGEPALANAFWDGDGIHFGDGGSTFFNLGLFADVIYHEYTHGITDFMYRPFGGLDGAEGGALHEGLSDYFACTLTGEPLVGENLYRDGSGSYLRNLDNTLVWPRDRRGEVHADGEIFAGALWDLRRSVGPAVADVLVHFARNLGPKTFAAYANAVQLQDDLQFGDGNADNGSPHLAEILLAFERHGLGPGLASGRRLVHLPLTDTENPGTPRRVVAGFEGHLSSPDDVLQLFYSTGTGYLMTPMARLPDGDFTAEIPAGALTDGGLVQYYIRLAPRRGVPVQTLPAAAPDSVLTFRVGADHEPPRIEFTAPAQTPVFAWPATVRAQIHDNQAVAYAYVETWRDGVPAGFLGMIRDRAVPGLFTARFPNIGGLATVWEYRVVAVDAAREPNRGCAPDCEQTFRMTLAASWDEDFASGTGGFDHASVRAGRADAWRLAEVPGPAPTTGWRAGGDAAEYAPGLAAALFTPAASVAAGAFVTVRSWIDAEPNGPHEAFDAGVVQIEVDDDHVWRPLVPDGGYPRVMADTGDTSVLPPGTPCLSGRDAVWRTLRFDLALWAGHQVRLRFVFASDGTPSSFGYRGWALDDFHFDPGRRDPTAIAPDASPAETRPRVAVQRSPACGRADFDLWIPAGPEAAKLTLYDVRGRRCRAWRAAGTGPGPQHLVWDGTGDGGVALPSGVYYYRLETSRGSAHGRFVFVR